MAALVLAAVALGAGLLAHPTRTAVVAADGRALAVPLPCWVVPATGSGGQPAWLALGDPPLDADLGALRFVERLGAARVYATTDLRIVLLTRKRTRLLTEITASVEPRVPDGP